MREIACNGEFGNIILLYVKGLLYSIQETANYCILKANLILHSFFVPQFPHLLNRYALN